LREGPVIFNNTNWNLTSLELDLARENQTVVVNRNMILEEYWIEFVDWTVGRSLRWWDNNANQPQTLGGILQKKRKKKRRRRSSKAMR
jgi:hypothetical protein